MKTENSSSLTRGVVNLIFLSSVNSCARCQEKVLECHWGRCTVKAFFLGFRALLSISAAERKQIHSQRSGIVVLRQRDSHQTCVHCGHSICVVNGVN